MEEEAVWSPDLDLLTSPTWNGSEGWGQNMSTLGLAPTLLGSNATTKGPLGNCEGAGDTLPDVRPLAT